MPRVAFTEDGEAVFVKTAVPLPVSDIAFNAAILEALNNISIQMELLNARIEEAFQTNINERDI